jgi:hypothetical protein
MKDKFELRSASQSDPGLSRSWNCMLLKYVIANKQGISRLFYWQSMAFVLFCDINSTTVQPGARFTKLSCAIETKKYPLFRDLSGFIW